MQWFKMHQSLYTAVCLKPSIQLQGCQGPRERTRLGVSEDTSVSTFQLSVAIEV